MSEYIIDGKQAFFGHELLADCIVSWRNNGDEPMEKVRLFAFPCGPKRIFYFMFGMVGFENQDTLIFEDGNVYPSRELAIQSIGRAIDEAAYGRRG